jgi:membrane associated rhomboid family serine protease
MYSAPKATWAVLRLLYMQIALCAAIILESALLQKSGIAATFALSFNGIFEHGFVWQIFTATLVHTNPLQLLFNSLTLWMFGSELEQRWGRSAFLRFYAICALGATLTFLGLGAAFPAMRGDVFFSSAGVNLGLLIAYAIYWPERQVWFFFLFPVRMKFVALITGVIALSYAVSSAPFVLSAAGHLGGLVAAGLLLLLTGGEPSRLGKMFSAFAARFRRESVYVPSGTVSGGTKGEPAIHEARIDAILDKISRDGMKSLTSAEKKFLRDASDRMNRTRH